MVVPALLGFLCSVVLAADQARSLERGQPGARFGIASSVFLGFGALTFALSVSLGSPDPGLGATGFLLGCALATAVLSIREERLRGRSTRLERVFE